MARFDDTTEPGLYQLAAASPPGGSAFATVAADARESDLRFLEPAETAALARDWPLSFEAEPDRLAGRLFAAGRGGRHEIWRYLVLATLGGLCVEIWLTRQLVKSRGIAGIDCRQESRLMSFDLGAGRHLVLAGGGAGRDLDRGGGRRAVAVVGIVSL